MPCKINRSRIWAGRMLLESQEHAVSLFVTLTFDEYHLPTDESVNPRDLQLFLKRVRKRAPVRFFGVGEYGDKLGRPHYHVALFGDSRLTREVVQQSWTLGFTHIGLLETGSAAYIAGYIFKGMMAHDDDRLDGRHPEFIRMSLKPGIGAKGVERMAQALTTRSGAAGLAVLGDVPTVVGVGGKKYPVGRYIANLIRVAVGRLSGMPQAKIDQYILQLMAESKAVRESRRKHHGKVAAGSVRDRKLRRKLK